MSHELCVYMFVVTILFNKRDFQIEKRIAEYKGLIVKRRWSFQKFFFPHRLTVDDAEVERRYLQG